VAPEIAKQPLDVGERNMNAEDRQEFKTPLIQRRYVECLGALALLFILQASFVPFDFSFDSVGEGSRVYFDSTVGRLTLSDIISNIFLYTPVGALGVWTLRRWGISRFVAALGVILFGALLSVTVEHVQYYSPSRVSSMIDVASNSVGVTVGVVLSFACQMIVPRMIEAIACEFREQPKVAIVKTYVLVLFLFASMPFAFSFDTNRLKQSVKSMSLRPFATGTWHEAPPDTAMVSANLLSTDYNRWTALRSWSRWALEFAAFVVFAWLVHSMCVEHYGFTRRATNWLTWWFAVALSIGLSILHIPLMMRNLDITDVMFRLLGVSVGVVSRSCLLDNRSGGTRTLMPATRQMLGRAAIAVCVLFIVYTGILPMTFSMPEGGVRSTFSSSAFLPFMAYFVTRFDLMMTDVMEKFASYAVLGVLLARFWRGAVSPSVYRSALSAATVCVLLACAVETVQLFIRVRVVSLTDPLLASGGAVVGVVGYAKFMVFYRKATGVTLREPDLAAAPGSGTLGPTDALIASLTEPHDEAPREPGRRPRRTTRW
jgi:glycopeptide antibiotics resistance protein